MWRLFADGFDVLEGEAEFAGCDFFEEHGFWTSVKWRAFVKPTVEDQLLVGFAVARDTLNNIIIPFVVLVNAVDD